MERKKLGKTGYEISRVIYGAIVSTDETQQDSDRFVAEAVDLGVNYFDVAPSYGNAQERLGPSLAPYRKRVYLACKTLERRKDAARKELEQSLKDLKTDWLDNYQLHSVTTREDVETAFGPGGAMELLRDMKEQGVIRKVGITAHSEQAALACLRLYPFDTVVFPINWMLHMGQGIGESLKAAAEKDGFGLLSIKSIIQRAWKDDGERSASPWPKSWCRPIDEKDSAFRLAAMRYALSLGAAALIPPGNWECFRFMAEHIDEAARRPLDGDDLALLRAEYEKVKNQPFFTRDDKPWA